MKIILQESADKERLEVEQDRLKIDRAKFEAEEEKRKQKPRWSEYLRNNFLAFVAALVSMATLAISASQVWVAQINKDKELALLKAQQDREWRYKALEFVANKSDIFFGSEPEKARRMAGALAVGFPREIADELLGKLQISAQENVVGAIAGVRADLSKSPFFKVPTSPRTISDIVIHVTESSDEAALHVLLDPNSPRAASYHYLILRDGKVMNLVAEANIAFHALPHNATTIGVAISSLGKEKGLPQVQYQAFLTLVAEIAKRYSIPVAHVVGHREILEAKIDCPLGVDMNTIRSDLQRLIQ